jgi:hypothetical protein
MQVGHRCDKLLDRIGLLRHHTKGLWGQTQFGHHLEINFDSVACYFFAPKLVAQDHRPSTSPHRTRYEKLTLATGTRPLITCRTCPTHFPRHSGGSLLPTRYPLRHHR